MGERYVLLGVAPARAGWFGRVAGWASAASLPAEFVRCVSMEEVAARLDGTRAFSALLADAATRGLDRDLVGLAERAGCPVVVVDGTDPRRRWQELGASAVLTPDFSRDELLETLADVAARVPTATFRLAEPPSRPSGDQGRLIGVTGPGGTGASVLAIALAQGLASALTPLPRPDGAPPPTRRPSVLLADLCRVADQAMLHDAQVLVPGVQELVEAHRTSRPSSPELLEQTFDVPARGYRLLLGLRRPRHWVGLRQQALDATLDSLQWLADVVVADVECDVEGEVETGSLDVEDRNLLARTTLPRADVVLVVGEPSMKGIAALVRTIADLVAFGVEPERLVPVANRSPRSPRRRAEVTSTVAELVASAAGLRAGRIAPVVHVPERDPEPALRDGVALAGPVPRLLAEAVAAVITRAAAVPPRAVPEPVPVVPGTLATFTSQEPPPP
jgi:hypothetical protein